MREFKKVGELPLLDIIQVIMVALGMGNREVVSVKSFYDNQFPKLHPTIQDQFEDILVHLVEHRHRVTGRPIAYAIAKNRLRNWLRDEAKHGASRSIEELLDNGELTYLIPDGVEFEMRCEHKFTLKKLVGNPRLRKYARDKITGESRHWSVKFRAKAEKELRQFALLYL